MGFLILGAILQYMVSASLSYFLWLVRVNWKELMLIISHFQLTELGSQGIMG